MLFISRLSILISSLTIYYNLKNFAITIAIFIFVNNTLKYNTMAQTFKNLDETFHSGKYKGQTLRDIWAKKPHYVGWLLNNVQGFYIDDAAFQEQIEAHPSRKRSLIKLQQKIHEQKRLIAELNELLAEEYETNDNSDYQSCQDDLERDTYYALGGDDYDEWCNSGGDLDRMMDNMGF